MIGKTISHYKILEKIGEGGMGVVYKAEDTKLKRTVALKFLPPELMRDTEAKERFIQEAQAAAALDHPNICTVHEIDETDDKTFIAMSYIEGYSLKDKIRAGALEIDEALEIAIQVAEGLKEAHEKGIVHRDIKPANIMLTKKGQAKIMDFGLAKLAGGIDLTKTATIMGTIAYMSPEQAKGEKVDYRTDIWSLGVVLYEMLTGELPFRGDYEQAVVHSILNEEPKPIAELRPDLPSELQDLLDRAMTKSPENRYQSAEKIVKDLASIDASMGDSDRLSLSALRTSKAIHSKRFWWVLAFTLVVVALAGFIYVTKIHRPQNQETTITGTPAGETTQAEFDKSIVVLPFEDISPTGDNEFFSDGLTDEIIADLSKIRSLRVISRTSAMTLKGTDMDIKAIGERLEVRYVLEGSVRKAGNELRITAQLIDATKDAHVWVEKYDGTMEDVFDIQEQVSRSIVGALKVELSSSENQMIAERPLDNVRAYELYLRARNEIGRMTEESLDRALEDLERGLDIVGENALIYAAMGYAYWQYINIGARTFEEFSGKVHKCVEKVFELEPKSTHGYMLLSQLELFRGNAKQQVEHLKKVLDRDPQNSDALGWLVFAYTAYAKMDAAWGVFGTIEKNDPLRPRFHVEKSYLYWIDGRYDLALKTVEKLNEEDFNIMGERFIHALMLIYNRRLDDASRAVARIEKDAPGSYYAREGRFLIDAYENKKSNVDKIMTPDFIASTKQDYQYSLLAAVGYSLLDDKDKALDWLENSVYLGFCNYIYMSEHDPFLENIRGEKRFKELMNYAKTQCDDFEVLE